MSNLLVIVMCLGAGLLLQRLRNMPDNTALVLNQYVINIALPALVLAELPKITLNSGVAVPVVASWGVMLLSVAVVLLLAHLCQWGRDVKAVMLLLVPLGNTSFVGFPMVEALLGGSALPYAIIYDQLGSFVAVSSYGMLVLAYFSGELINPRALLRKLLFFPPFIAVIVASFFLGREYPVWLYDSLSRIGGSLVPVVMIAVGLQWRLRLQGSHISPLVLALGLKLVLIPACLYTLFSQLSITGLPARASLLESAMPPMITAGALLISHNLAPRLASSIVGYGLLLSLLSVPLWSLAII